MTACPVAPVRGQDQSRNNMPVRMTNPYGVPYNNIFPMYNNFPCIDFGDMFYEISSYGMFPSTQMPWGTIPSFTNIGGENPFGTQLPQMYPFTPINMSINHGQVPFGEMTSQQPAIHRGFRSPQPIIKNPRDQQAYHNNQIAINDAYVNLKIFYSKKNGQLFTQTYDLLMQMVILQIMVECPHLYKDKEHLTPLEMNNLIQMAANRINKNFYEDMHEALGFQPRQINGGNRQPDRTASPTK